MEEFLNKSAWIKIKTENSFISFTAKKIINITPTHITFIDKFDITQLFLISDIVQIKELKKEDIYNDTRSR